MDSTVEESAVKSADEKKLELFGEQKRTLPLFLEKGAISKDQYEKSFGDLKAKMGIAED